MKHKNMKYKNTIKIFLFIFLIVKSNKLLLI